MIELIRKASDEKYYRSIRYFSHSLRGNIRRDFIYELSQHNMYLAAQCVMSAEKDLQVELELIRRAEHSALNFKDASNSANSFLALAEFEAFEVISKLLEEVKKPSKVHFEVFAKILEGNNQTTFISFLEVLTSVKKIQFILYAISSYNGELIIDHSNRHILRNLFKILFEQGNHGTVRIFLEKYHLFNFCKFLFDEEPSDTVSFLLNTIKSQLTALRLAYEICKHYNLFNLFPPSLFIRNALYQYRKSNKYFVFAINVAIFNNIIDDSFILHRLSIILDLTGKKDKKRVFQLIKAGIYECLSKESPLLTQLNLYISKFSSSENKEIRQLYPTKEFELKQSSISLNVEELKKNHSIKDLISLYLNEKRDTKSKVEDFISDVIVHYPTSLMVLAHFFREFTLVGTVLTDYEYGFDVACPLIFSNRPLFLHKQQIPDSGKDLAEVSIEVGSQITFRVIGINMQSYRMNISCRPANHFIYPQDT